MVLPVMVTTLLVPIVLVAKDAVAPDVDSVTTSPNSLPTIAADDLLSNAVADAVASYSRSSAVMPLMVKDFAVMDAVVVGWVSV